MPWQHLPCAQNVTRENRRALWADQTQVFATTVQEELSLQYLALLFAPHVLQARIQRQVRRAVLSAHQGSSLILHQPTVLLNAVPVILENTL
jgi:hypothetical protein